MYSDQVKEKGFRVVRGKFLSRHCENADRQTRFLFRISFTKIWKLSILLQVESLSPSLNYFEIENVGVCVCAQLTDA